MPSFKYLFTIPEQLWVRYRVLFWVNLIALVPFLAIALYIKIAAVSGYSVQNSFITIEYHEAIELLKELFGKPFNPIPYLGLFAKVSQLLWCFPIAICFFTASILENTPKTRRFRQFLWVSGSLLTLLLLDDVFRISLNLYSSSLNFHKHWLYYFYISVAIFSLIRFHRQILATPYGVLGISVFFFGMSLMAEFFPISGVGAPIMLEDGGQLLGILNVAAYFWVSCRQHLMGR